MSFFGFTSSEFWPYLGIFICIFIILVYNYQKGYQYLWSPLSIIAIIFAYYCLLGPYEAVSSGKTVDRLLNMRPFYSSAFWGAFVLIFSCIIGFHLKTPDRRQSPTPPYPIDTLFTYGRNICIIGFVLFAIATGGGVVYLINPILADGGGPTDEALGGSFANYLTLSLNFLIPGVSLLLAYSMKTNKRWAWFTVVLIVSIGVFTSLGFRYRLVLLLGSLAIIYYLSVKRRPNILLAFGFFVLFILAMGVINETRNYGRGLDTTRLENSNQSYYESGLNESRIFQTSGAVIDLTPSKIPHAGFTPIINTILFPIPSQLFPGKKSAEYLFNALNAIYGGPVSQGAAFMAYGEYYLAFGWFGIIIGGFLIGWFYKKLWSWYLADHRDPLHIAIYAVTVIYLYVIVSRGYLPQVTMLFFFSVFPVYIVRRIIKRRFAIPLVRKRVPVAHESYPPHPQPGQN
ncbi:MAG TPA: O-antigen polymerase [Cyclobacteriaceae bacterium]|nr:O-antigen polymerase [Cyclobacteriaceae bacterium]